MSADQSKAEITIQFAPESREKIGEHSVTLRATALKDGQWPVVAECEIPVTIVK